MSAVAEIDTIEMTPMAKKKPKQRKGSHNLNVRLTDSMWEALISYCESREPRILKTALIEMLITRHLVSEGFWVKQQQDDHRPTS